MPDREKIESLKQCLSASCRGFRTCPYSDTEWDAVETALTLLREQEPVKPIKKLGIVESFKCGDCEWVLGWVTGFPLYCPRCGRAVKWDG